MAITEAELQKVRVVLSGEASLQQMAGEYSSRENTLVCAAIFAAADAVVFTWKGEYGLVLQELVVGREPDDPEAWSSWRRRSSGLVCAARRIGLHKTVDRAGNEVEVRILPEMRQLLQEDETYRARAMGMYMAARQSVRQRHDQQILDRQHRIHQMKRFRVAMARSNVWGLSALKGHDLWTLREVHAELGRLLDKYFPED